MRFAAREEISQGVRGSLGDSPGPACRGALGLTPWGKAVLAGVRLRPGLGIANAREFTARGLRGKLSWAPPGARRTASGLFPAPLTRREPAVDEGP